MGIDEVLNEKVISIETLRQYHLIKEAEESMNKIINLKLPDKYEKVFIPEMLHILYQKIKIAEKDYLRENKNLSTNNREKMQIEVYSKFKDYLKVINDAYEDRIFRSIKIDFQPLTRKCLMYIISYHKMFEEPELEF